MRLLAVDIGNSSVKYGTFDGRRPGRSGSRDHEGSKAVVAGTVLSEAKSAGPDAVLISGVVPEILDHLAVRLKGEGLDVLRFRVDFEPLVETGTSVPEATGDDRLAAASAAFAEVKDAVIVLSVGTAVTVDAVEPSGVFLGGAILPGPQTALDALTGGTALLPPTRAVAPVSAVGRDTVQAMLCGCVTGTAGAVDRLVSESRSELGRPDCPVLLTGGASGLLYEYLHTACRREPALILQGLVLSYLEAK